MIPSGNRLSGAVPDPKKGVKKGKKISVLHKKTLELGGLRRCDFVDHRVDREPTHQPLELFRVEGPEFRRVSRPGKMTGLNPLVKEQESISLPEQAFDLGSGSSAEEKEGIRNE